MRHEFVRVLLSRHSSELEHSQARCGGEEPLQAREDALIQLQCEVKDT